MADTAPLVALSFEFPGEMDSTSLSTRKPIIRQLESPPRGARPREDTEGLRDKPPSTRASPTPRRKTAPAPLDLQDGSTSSSGSGSPVGPRTAPMTRSKPLPPTVTARNTSPGRRPLPQISTRPSTTKITSVRPLPSVPASSPDTSPVLRYPPPPYSVFSSATILDGVRPLPRPPGPVERRQLPPPPFSAMPALPSQDSTQQTTPKKILPSIKLDVSPNTLRRLTKSGSGIFGDVIRHLKGEEVTEDAFCEGILARMNSDSCTPLTPCSFLPSAMSKGEQLSSAISECGYAQSFQLDPSKEDLYWDERSLSTPNSHSKFSLSFRLDDEFYGDDSCPSTPDSFTPSGLVKRNTILSIANNCGESVSIRLDFERDDEDKEDDVAWDWLIKDGVMSPSIVQRQPLRFSKRWFREKNGGLVEEKDYCTVLNFLRSL